VNDPRTLGQLAALRRRARDAARQRLAQARAEHTRLEDARRGWREHVPAERAAAGDDAVSLARWLDARRAQEGALAAEAARLAAVVTDAANAQTEAELKLEQIDTLAARV